MDKFNIFVRDRGRKSQWNWVDRIKGARAANMRLAFYRSNGYFAKKVAV